jgi:hypothetical protein
VRAVKREPLTSEKSSGKEEYVMVLIVFFLTLIGLTVRLVAPLQSNFPLNDGGLFYAMIVDLQKAGYVLPFYVNYNAASIPFAYPPLAFYLTGWLADFLRIPVLDLLRILPAIISGLTIPAFYFLAREFTSSKIQILLALFAFALLPRDFAWLIMGGGITRSFGLLFALLTMFSAYRFYNGHRTPLFLSCILFGALTTVTHPEAAVHTAITALVFYLWKDRSLKGLLLSLGVSAGILALTSPWWSTVISRHSAGPFLAALSASGQDSFNPLVSLILFSRFLFTNEPFLPILAVLGLIGLFASLARRQTLLPAWTLILYIIEPRGGPLYMMIPLALLIGYALDNVILPALRPKGDNPAPANAREALESLFRLKAPRYFLIFLFAYSTLSAYSTSMRTKDEFSLGPEDLEAFAWVKENTPEDSQFLLVTGQLPLRDAWSEWFPVLTERHSQATVFGYEWVNDGKFGNRVEAYKDLQACSHEDLNCLDEWDQGSNNPYSHVYIYNSTDPIRFPLTIHLQRDDRYELLFKNDQTMVFQKAR